MEVLAAETYVHVAITLEPTSGSVDTAVPYSSGIVTLVK